MNLSVLIYFLAVCNTHSFSKAARFLYLSPQGLSKSVKKLEEDLGCTLFNRTPAGLYLTPAGKILKAHAQKIVNELSALQADLNSLSKKEVVIGATMGVYQILNTPLINILQKDYPDLLISYIESWDLQCEDNILDHVYDLALTSGPVNREKFNSDILHISPICAMVKKGHSLYNKDCLTIHDLEPYPILLVSSHFRLYYNFLDCCRKSGFEPVIYDTAVIVERMFHCCSDGQVIGIVIDSFIESRHVSDCRFIPISMEDICWELLIVSAKDSILSPQACHIHDFILTLQI